MLFDSLSEPDSAVHHTQLVISDTAPLDLALFRVAWQRLARRHNILRAHFVWRDAANPYQIVDPVIEPSIDVHDWGGVSSDGLDKRIAGLVADDRLVSLDLSQAPMWRVTIGDRVGAGYHALWTFHHSMLDGWSYTKLVAELYRSYDALRAGHEEPLSPLAHTFDEFVHWLNLRDNTSTQDFWREYLAGFETPTPLGVPWPLVPTAEPRGMLNARVSAATLAELQVLAKRARASLFTVITAAWSLLLHHHSGEPEVLFGMTLAGRRGRLDGIRDIMGPLITTPAVRVATDSDMIVTEWLKALRVQLRAVGAHQQISVPELLALSDVSAGLPLYESMLVFHDDTLDGQVAALYENWSGRSLTRHQQASLPLRLDVFVGDGLEFELRYFRDRFDDETADRLLRSYGTILASLAHDAPQRIGDISHLPPVDRERLLVEWNETTTKFAQAATVHSLFDRIAEIAPQAEALVCGDQRLSYVELEGRANQLAHFLVRAGAAPGVPIGLCVGRSPDLIIALLAILKTGGAYVPMDPAYPPERLAYMSDTADCQLIVSEADFASVASGGSVRVVALDADREAIACEDESAPEVTIDPESPAYVIFTSGSSGHPKGVPVPHRAVVNFLLSMHMRPGLDSQSRLLAVTTPSFDIHVLELFGPLTVGGTVVLASREDTLDGHRLRDLIDSCDVNCMQATPTTWRQLLASGWADAPHFEALVGGEPLPRDLLRELLGVLPRVWNMYGPTETTVWSTCAELTDPDGPILIGRPIANTKAYVLDAELDPVPIGSSGELYIGGAGVALGYVGRPELTGERFLANPFSRGSGRIYRTGDIVRYFHDGSLEFLDRIDSQVKLRGFRIELGEIEATLVSHPDVVQAVARVWGHGGDASLAAYVVAHDGRSPSRSTLLAHLRHRLPEYMMPARFVTLDALPLTANGKLDRDSLPEPGVARLERDDRFVGPRNELERMVVEIWEKTLGLSSIGINHNFFEIGGNSLFAIRVADEMSRVIGRTVGVEVLFKCPTIERFVGSLGDDVEHDYSLVRLGHGGTRSEVAPLYCLSGIYIYEPLASALQGKIDVYGIVVRGEIGSIDKPTGLGNAVAVTREIAADYVAVIRKHRPLGPYRLAGLSFGGAIAFEAARQLCELGENVECVVLFDTAIPQRASGVLERLVAGFDEFRALGLRYPVRFVKRSMHLVSMASRRLWAMLNSNYLVSVVKLDTDRRIKRLAYLQRYRPEVIDARLFIFRAGDGARLRSFTISPKLGWEGMGADGVDVYETSGDHVGMLDREHVAEIATVLKRELFNGRT